MIDPKMLELSVYDGIPHLLAPVVTEPGKAVVTSPAAGPDGPPACCFTTGENDETRLLGN
uniref:FtsK domain-containing protein n=1 Tax=Magnetospirillum gryphiswaldense TaxID=55518 RepID=A4TTN7_9PROT|nr:hypothetical protein MGR_2580 [Magnetospirillum gryphiswaldense MSR-1]